MKSKWICVAHMATAYPFRFLSVDIVIVSHTFAFIRVVRKCIHFINNNRHLGPSHHIVHNASHINRNIGNKQRAMEYGERKKCVKRNGQSAICVKKEKNRFQQMERSTITLPSLIAPSILNWKRCRCPANFRPKVSIVCCVNEFNQATE